MASVCVQNLTYRFDDGHTLFSDLTFTLDNNITGLVGRNGAGKSVLAALLVGERVPYSGSVTAACKVGWLRQVGAEDKLLQYDTISDFLGVRGTLESLARVAAGGCDPQDFERIGDQWLLREVLEKQLQVLGLPIDPYLACTALSGGQLTRLALHKLLQSNCEYLILDEPSNHLDAEGRSWLIEQIRGFNGGVLIISHDRDLLRCVDSILELNSLGVHFYGGNYDVYVQQRDNELAGQERRIEKTKTQIRQMRQTVQKNREKAQQRASQGKQIARSGSQAKILLNNNKQNAQRSLGSQESNESRRLAQAQAQLKEMHQQHEVLKQQSLSLGKATKRVSRVLDVTGVCLPFNNQPQEITFSVDFGEKVRLSGSNGSGKSTLLKVIAGHLLPVKGDIKVRSRLCYLDQHFRLLDKAQSAQDNLARLCVHLTETDRRTLLAGIGLNRTRADQQVTTLSGGEKMKVAMLAISHQSCDTLLLLDEPDNHLDIDSRLMLAQALRHYMGSLLIVSHDQDFINDIGVTEEICLACE